MSSLSMSLQNVCLISVGLFPFTTAVMAALWGNIRYYSSSSCPSGSMTYVESFPLNVCYRTGNTPYWKMNTVLYNGVPNCPSCWRYQRILYRDNLCQVLYNSQVTPVYRDTSVTCAPLANNNGVWASTATSTFNYASTGVSSSDIDGSIRAHSYETPTCAVAPAESILLKSSFCAGGIKALCSGSGANVYAYTASDCATLQKSWSYKTSTNCTNTNRTASTAPFPYFAGYAYASFKNYQVVDVSRCNPTPLTALQVRV